MFERWKLALASNRSRGFVITRYILDPCTWLSWYKRMRTQERSGWGGVERTYIGNDHLMEVVQRYSILLGYFNKCAKTLSKWDSLSLRRLQVVSQIAHSGSTFFDLKSRALETDLLLEISENHRGKWFVWSDARIKMTSSYGVTVSRYSSKIENATAISGVDRFHLLCILFKTP